ncbi:MAG: transposase [Pseudomonadales bacterium]|jgi:transposase-like protein|tara:strand:+ start:70 stop:372 length:303 start_codon:yes stop_codon:yes gene_type:complete
MNKRQSFSKEFKLEAVRLLEEGKKPAADIARELGIPRNRLYKWKEQIDHHGENAFPGHGRRPSSDAQATEISRLKRELERSQEENEILKKAAAFFARELL